MSAAGSGELIYAAFGADCDLYEVFGVPRTATDKDLTRAYRKLALKYHPDKQRGDEAAKAQATAKFQAISAIHSLLSDAEARAYYDETGAIMSADQYEKSPSFQMWVDYFARIFPKVTESDIAKFSDEYRFSDEERRDVLDAYAKVKGDMQGILNSVMLSTDDDEERFAAMIERAIESEQLEALPKWRAYRKRSAGTPKKAVSEAQRKKQQAKKDKEAREAEELMRKIRGSQEQRANGGGSSALSTKRLETRYAEKQTTKRKTKQQSGVRGSKRKAAAGDTDAEEPSEEAFVAAQKRLKLGKKARK
ncbi:hypothetical protein PybrP1_010086 [[Pythium] brassicae (nom. inval.)]|nr:hypothetical protein PybrP1_010086 [[Pythium] brassicae (nom. inval.)]